MKSLGIHSRTIFAAASAIVLFGGVGVFRAKADAWDKKTVLTIHEPIQVRERVLEPGTYVFKLLNSSSDRHIVQIFNQDQTRIVDTILAIPNYRLEPTGDSRFRFWETPPGHAKALRAWFYPGDNFGQEFPYPKHLAVTETASVSTPAPAMPAPAPMPEPAPAPVAPPVQTQAEQPYSPPPPPAEVARNAPAPAPAPEPEAEPAPAPSPAPQAPETPAPQTLPKTAGEYSAIGLAGLACMGIFGLLRNSKPKQRS